MQRIATFGRFWGSLFNVNDFDWLMPANNASSHNFQQQEENHGIHDSIEHHH
jgi:hypothetical protein